MMRTLGEILKKARQEKQLTLEEVEKEIRVKKEYLGALENDDYQKLPSFIFASGVIKNYAQFLDKQPEILLAIFRRDFKLKEKKDLMPVGLVRPINTKGPFWTPKMTMITLGVAVALIIGFYLYWQYQSLVKAPYFKP